MAGVGGWVEKWPDCRPMISALARRYAPCCGCRRLCAYADNDAQAARALNDASSAGFGITCNFDVDAPRSGPGWVPRARLACSRQGWVGGGALTHHPLSGRPAGCVKGLTSLPQVQDVQMGVSFNPCRHIPHVHAAVVEAARHRTVAACFFKLAPRHSVG